MICAELRERLTLTTRGWGTLQMICAERIAALQAQRCR